MEKQTNEQVMANRMRLRTSIAIVRWLAFQAYPFCGRDESPTLRNQGNFLEMVKLLASYDEGIKAILLGNVLQDAKYTSPHI